MTFLPVKNGARTLERRPKFGPLLRNLRKFLCLRRRHVKLNAVILQVKTGRRNRDFMLAEAQEAADIGAQFGDLVVGGPQDCRDLTEFLAVAAVDVLPDPGLGLLVGNRRLRGGGRSFDVLSYCRQRDDCGKSSRKGYCASHDLNSSLKQTLTRKEYVVDQDCH